MITSWRIWCSLYLVGSGMLLAGYETIFGDARTSVYFFCSGVISLGLGLRVDDVIRKTISRDKDDA